MEDIVVFLGLKVFNSYMFSCSRNAQVTHVEKLQLIIISFPLGYLIHTRSDKAF